MTIIDIFKIHIILKKMYIILNLWHVYKIINSN
jgi:hypothetical protein